MSTYGLTCTGRGGDHTITHLLEVSSSFTEALVLLGLVGLITILISLIKQTASFALLLIVLFPSREASVRKLFRQTRDKER